MTDATGDRWVKCEELRFRGDGACFAWRKATVDEIVEHFKKQIIMGYIYVQDVVEQMSPVKL